MDRCVNHHGMLPALLLAALGMMGSGCANQQGAANPFLTADRVPPPQTRLAPAAGQPYYQGDVTPILPGYAPQGAAPGYMPAPTLSAAPQPAPPATFATNNAAASNEAVVSIPEDDAALRFAYTPPPAPAAPQPFVQAQVTPMQPSYSAAPVSPTTFIQPQNTFANAQPQAAGSTHGPMQVTLAPVNAPAMAVTQPAGTNFAAAATSGDNLPWVSGSAPRSAAVAPQGVQQAAYIAAAPRVRLPGYPTPQQTFVAPQQMSPTTSGVQITEMPVVTTPQPSTSGSSDGFRPRSSARSTL